mmetsp:Transcript_38171/g.62065  ORF Transcript_38171/g.62065 Transcript_38171/m.62065 type:complete len:123 (+) Transcript_38171:689-1057(+)
MYIASLLMKSFCSGRSRRGGEKFILKITKAICRQDLQLQNVGGASGGSLGKISGSVVSPTYTAISQTQDYKQTGRYQKAWSTNRIPQQKLAPMHSLQHEPDQIVCSFNMEAPSAAVELDLQR